MALTTADFIATVVHTSTGNAVTKYDFPNVDFINPDTDIEVRVNNTVKTITTDYTIEVGGSAVTERQIQFTVAGLPAENVTFQLRRKTTRGSREVDFTQGSTLTEADLDTSAKQGIYLAEEAIDTAVNAEDIAKNIVIESGNLPDPLSAADNDMLQISGGAWVIADILSSVTALLGTSAVIDTGTAIDKIPVNTSSGALAASAYTATGTADAEIPLNSDLGSVRTLDAGYEVGNVPTIITGNKIGPIKEITYDSGYGVFTATPSCEVIHKVAAGEEGNEAGTSYVKETWHKRPLTDITECNGSFSTGITLAANVLTMPEGVWKVDWQAVSMRQNIVVTRLAIDGGDTIIQGLTHRSTNTSATVTCVGMGRFTTATDDDICLEFAVDETQEQKDIFGDAMNVDIDTVSLENICTRIMFIKEG